MGRQPANTKLSSHVAVRKIRVRGGNSKFRALRLDHGTYSWGSEVRAAAMRMVLCCAAHACGGEHWSMNMLAVSTCAGRVPQGPHPGRGVQRVQQRAGAWRRQRGATAAPSAIVSHWLASNAHLMQQVVVACANALVWGLCACLAVAQVRTQTLVKNAIVQVDAAPFKAWYQTHYGVELGQKGKEEAVKVDEKTASNHVKRKLKQRLQTRKLDAHLAEQFTTGRLLACIASRPGQSGRCDGYILEGERGGWLAGMRLACFSTSMCATMPQWQRSSAWTGTGAPMLGLAWASNESACLHTRTRHGFTQARSWNFTSRSCRRRSLVASRKALGADAHCHVAAVAV